MGEAYEMLMYNIFEYGYIKEWISIRGYTTLTVRTLLYAVKDKMCYCCGVNRAVCITKKNNLMPFIEMNSVGVCYLCKKMKQNLSLDIFLKRCQHIAKFNHINETFESDYDLFYKYHKRGSFKQYKQSAERRNIEFSISESEFDFITGKTCYICGETNLATIGVDRYNNRDGYTIENSMPCCTECNYSKSSLYIYDFFMNIKMITEQHPEKIVIRDYSQNNILARYDDTSSLTSMFIDI